jgi:hypothetical protein
MIEGTRRVRLVLYALIAITAGSCTSQTQQPDVGAYANSQARVKCGLAEEQKQGTYLQWAKCYDNALRQGFAEMGYELARADELMLSKQKALLSIVDKGQMTYEEYRFELDAYWEHILASDRAMQLQNLQKYDLMNGPPRQPRMFRSRF